MNKKISSGNPFSSERIILRFRSPVKYKHQICQKETKKEGGKEEWRAGKKKKNTKEIKKQSMPRQKSERKVTKLSMCWDSAWFGFFEFLFIF